ncbi:MAG: glutathione S-transferase family protein [Burkholderiales bacterium]|nr:glutathione S-transferase family protein [Burkholderiales bacterium]
MSLTLVIGNKNYSSWSMRPWVLLRQFGIPFNEVMLKFESAEWDEHISRLAPTRKVPTLWDGDAGAASSTPVWETIAIIEYIADRFPQFDIWPRDVAARAMARAVSAEMHAGFQALRSNMPMNIRSQHPGKGMKAGVAEDIARIEAIWRVARERFGSYTESPFLFGQFSAADAMFAPVVMRFLTYMPSLVPASTQYCEAMKIAPAIAAWITEAQQETEFVGFDEPNASPPV